MARKLNADDRSQVCSVENKLLSYVNLYSFKSVDFSFCRALLRNPSENSELRGWGEGKKLVRSEIKNTRRCTLEKQYFKTWPGISFPFIQT